jgi:hypothetical protein
MTNTGLVVRVWNDAAIARRDEDSFCNATAMCQANGREWKAYHRIDTTKAYIQALAASLDLTPADLVITTTTGPNEFRGTWIHPRLAVDLARWISPEFAVWMDGWFLEQINQPPATAPGLTVEDVARIVAEAMRGTVQTVQTVQIAPRRPYRRVRIDVPAESEGARHLRLMHKIHAISERIGRIGWRDLHHCISRSERLATCPNQWLAAIRDLEALGAGEVILGSRQAPGYRATSRFPDPVD